MIRAVDGNPCVLFVDDEEMTRKTFERIASHEFPVLLASDVADAIKILQSRGDEIGVLLTDQRMPGGLGVELLEYAREHNPSIVRMLTTAYSDLEDAIAAVNRGEIIRYIEKPWTNIDALLIDLRVAMRFHQLEVANEQLMAEKMSAKARGARIERLQALAALAASQTEPEVALRALEDMLRSLSELFQRDTSGAQLNDLSLYSGPAEEAANAILLADRFGHHKNSSPELNTWSDIFNVTVSGNAANANVKGALVNSAGEIAVRAAALFSDSESSVEVSATLVETGTELCVTNQHGSANLFKWVNIGSDTESICALADLLKLYCEAYSVGAAVDLDFNDDGALDGLRVLFSESEIPTALTNQDEDWLEDIVILFS